MQHDVDNSDHGADEQHEDDDLDRGVLQLLAVGPGDLPHLVLDLVIELRHPARKAAALDYLDRHLLRFLMQLVGVAAWAILLPLDALGVQALVLVGEVVAVFAGLASANDFFTGHCSVLADWIAPRREGSSRWLLFENLGYDAGADGAAAFSD